MKIPFSLIDVLSNIGVSLENKEFIDIGDWQAIDAEYYKKYENKLKITGINYIDCIESQRLDDYIVNDIRIHFETKKEYGLIKYNINFIAYLLAEREYEIHTQELKLIAINKNIVDNYKKKLNKPPQFEKILKALGWSITKKSLQSIKEKLYLIEKQ